MPKIYLIDADDLRANIKQISIHVDDQLINNSIIEAQEIDLSPIIGEQVYISILENKGSYTDVYKNLMDGCIYTYEDNKYELRGIKVALCYLAYARIIKSVDNSVSRSGFLQKDNDHSVHSAIKERLAAANEAAGTGVYYANKCLDYILRNISSFPVYSKLTKSKKKFSINVLGD